MTAQTLPEIAVRREVIALASGQRFRAFDPLMQAGTFPRPDTSWPRLWKLSTLERHDPALANRCRLIADFLNTLSPPKAA